MKELEIITKFYETSDKTKIERGLKEVARDMYILKRQIISINATSYTESESGTSMLAYTILVENE